MADTIHATKEQPERQAEVREITGSNELTYNVDWASFTPEALNFVDNAAFHRISMAFRGVCTDTIAKELIQKKLKVIELKNGTTSEVKFEEPRLLVQGEYSKGISNAPSDRQIEIALMEGLKVKFARQLKRVLDEQLPARLAELKEILGSTNCQISPDLPTFHSAEALEFFDNVALLRLMMSMRTLAADPTSKKLVVDNLKKVVFHNVRQADETKLTYSGGVLEIWAVYDRSAPDSSASRLVSHDEITILLQKNLAISESMKKREILDKTLPERQKEINEIFGHALPYEIDWSTFATDNEFNYFDNCACHRINMAFRCLDAATKTKLQASLKHIAIKNVKAAAEKKLEVANGALVMHCMFDAGLSGCYSDNAILAALKKSTK